VLYAAAFFMSRAVPALHTQTQTLTQVLGCKELTQAWEDNNCNGVCLGISHIFPELGEGWSCALEWKNDL
jgi:hypothetical protein